MKKYREQIYILKHSFLDTIFYPYGLKITRNDKL